MEKLKHEYLSTGWDPRGVTACRDSRYAFGFGHRLQVDKPRVWLKEVLYILATIALAAFVASVWIYFRIR